jgi:hypothetical protein
MNRANNDQQILSFMCLDSTETANHQYQNENNSYMHLGTNEIH